MASVYDELINECCKTGNQQCLNDATKIVNEAKPCGNVGFIFLNELLNNLKSVYKKNVKQNVIVNPCHPTYYGMMVSEFIID